MTIIFPDGNSLATSSGLRVAMASSSPIIYFYDSTGVANAFTYVAFSAVEQILIFGEIRDAIINNIDVLEIVGLAPLPTATNNLATDMYPNADNTTPTAVSVNGYQVTSLTIGYGSGNGWPPPVNGGTAMVASFQPEAKITIGGTPVTELKYINGVTLSFRTPQKAAGTYNMVYTDNRGSVTKVNAFIYS